MHTRQVLAEMSAEEQRQFLFFVSGTPRLPIGGMSAALRRAVPRSAAPVVTCICRVLKQQYMHARTHARKGFQGLQPRLTVVRKDGECAARPQDYLPSVTQHFFL